MAAKIRKFTTILVTTFFCLIIVAATATPALALTINGKAAILIDAASGEVLFQQNADQALVPGSMVKLMTAYILLDQVKQGECTLATPVAISSKTAALSQNKTYSNVPLQANQTYSMKQLLESIITVSACASAQAVAEAIDGSEAAFTLRMNQYAQNMGLHARFADASGISPHNQITARSMATLAQRLIADFPEILSYTKRLSINFADKTYYSTNKMLDGMPQDYFGMDGLKTGYISAAKYCFTGTAQREDVRLIGVVMGTKDFDSRCTETKKLFDYGFEQKNIQLPWKHATAYPSNSQVLVDGQALPFEVYDIEGSHYFALRDIAAALNNTTKSCSVEWSAEQSAILLNTPSAYLPQGDELSGGSRQIQDSWAINSKIRLNGAPVRFKGYSIDGNCFFNLRDIAAALNLCLVWDSASKTLLLDTTTDKAA